MADVDFITIMSPEEVAAARRGGEIVYQHRTGAKLRTELYEAFTVGAGLLISRAAAMRAANTSEPVGQNYALAFAQWKATS